MAEKSWQFFQHNHSMTSTTRPFSLGTSWFALRRMAQRSPACACLATHLGKETPEISWTTTKAYRTGDHALIDNLNELNDVSYVVLTLNHSSIPSILRFWILFVFRARIPRQGTVWYSMYSFFLSISTCSTFKKETIRPERFAFSSCAPLESGQKKQIARPPSRETQMLQAELTWNRKTLWKVPWNLWKPNWVLWKSRRVVRM